MKRRRYAITHLTNFSWWCNLMGRFCRAAGSRCTWPERHWSLIEKNVVVGVEQRYKDGGDGRVGYGELMIQQIPKYSLIPWVNNFLAIVINSLSMYDILVTYWTSISYVACFTHIKFSCALLVISLFRHFIATPVLYLWSKV